MSRISVYIADVTVLQEEDLYRRLYSHLDDERRRKADRMLLMKDRRLSVGAGGLLLYALFLKQEENASVRIQKNGKPYLVGKDNLYFNLSHSGTMVMCATADQEVGCDVEQMDTLERNLAEFVMTKQELQMIYEKEDADRQREMFFRLWTLKESYMKATGQGILLEPGRFGMVFGKDGIRAAPAVDERKFYFKEYKRNDGYCYSCCSQSEDFPDAMIEVDLRKVLEVLN